MEAKTIDQILTEAAAITGAADSRWSRLHAAVRSVCERIGEVARMAHIQGQEPIGNDLESPPKKGRPPSPYFLVVTSDGTAGVWCQQQLHGGTDILREYWRISRPGEEIMKRPPRHVLEACVPALRPLAEKILFDARTTADLTEKATRDAEKLAKELGA